LSLSEKKKKKMEDTPIEEGETNKDIEVAPALIAVHPTQKSVAVAVGSDLRVFDLQYVKTMFSHF
jgi:tRNA (guanine-N(7)-)-methyltransferase subunit TRM82